MEDRYLCKAKRTDNGEWIIGGLVRYGFAGREKYYIVPNYASDLYALEIDPSTICWCTGLKDKNGKLIFENDIVETQYGKPLLFGISQNGESNGMMTLSGEKIYIIGRTIIAGELRLSVTNLTIRNCWRCRNDRE